MLAIIAGDISLLLGFVILLLPLIITELSRPRDAFVGAILLFLGIVLISQSDRFLGAPMLAVVFGSVLIGRLGFEISESRWRQLSTQEKKRLFSLDRWFTGFKELGAALLQLLSIIRDIIFIFRKKPLSVAKKWVRPEKSSENEVDLKINLNEENEIFKNKHDSTPEPIGSSEDS